MTLVRKHLGEPYASFGFTELNLVSPTASPYTAQYFGYGIYIQAQDEFARKITDLRILFQPFYAEDVGNGTQYSLDRFVLVVRIGIYTASTGGNRGKLVYKLGEYGLNSTLLGVKLPDFELQPKQELQVEYMLMRPMSYAMFGLEVEPAGTAFEFGGVRTQSLAPVAVKITFGYTLQGYLCMLTHKR